MTLNDAKRICAAYHECDDCPFRLQGMCVLKDLIPSDWDISEVRKAAEKWLKEHPGPIYPTYYNWLVSEGVYDFGERISAEFAEKYGIEPIEGVKG